MNNVVVFLIASFIAAFSSGQETQSSRVTFDEAVSKVLSQSYNVQKAQLDVLIAQADRMKTVAQMGPRVRGTYLDTIYDTELKADLGNGNSIVTRPLRSQTGTISIAVNLSAIAAGILKIRTQTSVIGATHNAKEAIATESAFAVAEIYRLAQQAKEAVEVAQSRLETTKKQTHDAEYLFAYGKIAKAEKLQLDLSHNNAQLGLAQAQNDFFTVQDSLKKLILFEGAQAIELDPIKDLTPEMVDDVGSSTELLSEALLNRSDLAAAQLKMSAAERGRWLYLWTYIPFVDVSMNWQKSFGETSFLSRDFSQYLLLNVTWDFWDSGASILDYRKGALEYRKAQIDTKEKTEDVRISVDAAVRNLKLAKESLLLSEVGLSQAQESYRGNSARFALGAVSVTDLLFSEDALNRAKLNHLAATVGIDVANMKLQKALGKKRPLPL